MTVGRRKRKKGGFFSGGEVFVLFHFVFSLKNLHQCRTSASLKIQTFTRMEKNPFFPTDWEEFLTQVVGACKTELGKIRPVSFVGKQMLQGRELCKVTNMNTPLWPAEQFTEGAVKWHRLSSLMVQIFAWFIQYCPANHIDVWQNYCHYLFCYKPDL